jgi:hypothetical protein
MNLEIRHIHLMIFHNIFHIRIIHFYFIFSILVAKIHPIFATLIIDIKLLLSKYSVISSHIISFKLYLINSEKIMIVELP